MEFAKNIGDLKKNMQTLDEYLDKRCEPEYSFALDLIKRGHCFIIVYTENGYRFYPSKFMGYAANTMSNHLKNNDKNGLETNPVIISILNEKPLERSVFEKEYIKYCDSLGINVYKTKRKYWNFFNNAVFIEYR